MSLVEASVVVVSKVMYFRSVEMRRGAAARVSILQLQGPSIQQDSLR